MSGVVLYGTVWDKDMFVTMEEMLVTNEELELVVEIKVIEIDFWLVVFWSVGLFAAILESCSVAVGENASIVC